MLLKDIEPGIVVECKSEPDMSLCRGSSGKEYLIRINKLLTVGTPGAIFRFTYGKTIFAKDFDISSEILGFRPYNITRLCLACQGFGSEKYCPACKNKRIIDSKKSLEINMDAIYRR